MTESLLNLSLKKVIPLFEKDDFEIFRIPVEDISNSILDRFLNDQNFNFSEEFIDKITEKLNVTKVKLDRSGPQESIFDLVSNLNLKELKIGEKFEKPKIIETLRQLVNKTSRKGIEKLSIEGVIIDCKTMKMLSEFLPSLTSLRLRNCDGWHLDLDNSLKNLKILDLSNSRVQNLTGLSNLKNLEVLNLSDIVFFSDIVICKLNKLRVLDIGFHVLDRTSELFKNLLEFGKSLPELRFIDCAANNMDLEDLEKLVITYPKLELIGLIGTSLDKTPQFNLQNRKLKLLTTENLENCLDSLEHYTRISPNSTETVVYIMDEIKEQVSDFSEDLKDVDLRRCFNVLISILAKKGSADTLSSSSVEVLKELITLKPNIWTLNDCSNLIRTFIKMLENPAINQDDSGLAYQQHVAVWAILEITTVFEASSGYINKLCEVGTEALKGCLIFRSDLLRAVITYLGKALGKISIVRGAALVKGYSILYQLSRFIPYLDLVRDEERVWTQCFLNTLRYYIRFSLSILDGYFEKLNSRLYFVRKIFQRIEAADDEGKRMLLGFLAEVLSRFLRPMSLITAGEDVKLKILTLLNNHKTVCVPFLVDLWIVDQRKRYAVDEAAMIVASILASLSNFNIGDPEDIVRFAVRNRNSFEGQEWALWLANELNIEMQQDEEEEGPPRAKRRCIR